MAIAPCCVLLCSAELGAALAECNMPCMRHEVVHMYRMLQSSSPGARSIKSMQCIHTSTLRASRTGKRMQVRGAEGDLRNNAVIMALTWSLTRAVAVLLPLLELVA